jgi:hypothetical protein
MRWQVKKGLNYTVDYKQIRIARKARRISITVIALILITLLWVWYQERKRHSINLSAPNR